MKRLCLFAGYSKLNIIEDYVVYYLKELSKFADIYYCADCTLSPQELAKIKPYTKLCLAKRHQKYDFGSWGTLFAQVPNLDNYDELILANDSSFGPLYPLDNIFSSMENKNVSAWSLCGNKFMMSFFIVLKRDVFLTPWFNDFMAGIREDIAKSDIVRIYEKGLSQLIEKHGLKWDSLFSKHNLNAQIKDKYGFVKQGLKTIPLSIRMWHRFRPNKTRVYDDDYFIMFLLGMPLIKKLAFSMNSNHFNILAPLFIKKYSSYDYKLIEESLQLNDIKPLYVPLKQKISTTIRHFIFDKRYKSSCIIYRVCKIPVYAKKHSVN